MTTAGGNHNRQLYITTAITIIVVSIIIIMVARHRSNRDLVENVVATTWITATQTLHFKPILGPIFGGKPGR